DVGGPLLGAEDEGGEEEDENQVDHGAGVYLDSGSRVRRCPLYCCQCSSRVPVGAGGHDRQRIAPARQGWLSDNAQTALRQSSAYFRPWRAGTARPECWRSCPPAPTYLQCMGPVRGVGFRGGLLVGTCSYPL